MGLACKEIKNASQIYQPSPPTDTAEHTHNTDSTFEKYKHAVIHSET